MDRQERVKLSAHHVAQAVTLGLFTYTVDMHQCGTSECRSVWRGKKSGMPGLCEHW